MTNYLLDTHIFIWVDKGSEKITHAVEQILHDPDNRLHMSIVSFWEMQIKIQQGKLTISKSIEQILSQIKKEATYQILPVTEQHVINLEKLPNIHRDPFDRMMISQAITEDMVFISQDSLVKKYPIQVVY